MPSSALGKPLPHRSRRVVKSNQQIMRSAPWHTGSLQTAFTILELLVLVGVLSVLLAILLPSTKSLFEAAKRRRAQTEATALAQAAIRYKTEYGFWPGQVVPHGSDPGAVRLNPSLPQQDWQPVIVSRGGDTTFTLDFDTSNENTTPAYIDGTAANALYRAFARVWQDSPNATPKLNPLNPRGITFLELQNENDIQRVAYPDPWGRAYIVMMGLNPASTFTHYIKNSSGNTIARHTISNQIAFAFSRGSPALSTTNYIYSAGVQP